MTRRRTTSRSICNVSALMKRSAGAPSSIWRESTLEAAKLSVAVSPVSRSHCLTAAVRLSVRLTAAETRSGAREGLPHPTSVAASAATTSVRHRATEGICHRGTEATEAKYSERHRGTEVTDRLEYATEARRPQNLDATINLARD